MEEKDELEVRTSFGSMRAGGSVVVIVLVMVCCSGALGYMIRDHDLRNIDRASNITKNINDLKDAMNEQTYVATLTDAQKRDLKLDMPESLRRKIVR